MHVTIKDIARIAGVSHTTVSRALNDSPLIQAETKRKIRKLADELNYIPNVSAKSLVNDRSYVIGLFFTTLRSGTSSVFFHETVKGVDAAVKDRYHLVVKGIDAYDSYDKITRRSFDGIVLMSQSTDDDRFIRAMTDKGMPIVVLNRHVEREDVVNILSDDCQGAFSVVDYMIRQGHRGIAVIGGKQGFKSAAERLRGYETALRHHGLPIKAALQAIGQYDLQSGYAAMVELLDRPGVRDGKVTAVFCSSDEMAMGAIKALSERSIRVPEQMSVAGFDDNYISSFITPALTTVRRPIEQIGKAGGENLLAMLEMSGIESKTIYMDTELVVRDSVNKTGGECL